ncbi:MAG: hypothetical protein KJ592_02150 [Nanoarchaeota archaeon]|nr:hypothetical protein [Nanoarchaeota archaeon]
MVTTITEVLNIWNDMGVFSYVIPFLLIFAVVFAILDKTKMFSHRKSDGNYDENRWILTIIAFSIALLSLQFDSVSNFFAVIFPRFGVGLAIFLTLLIFLAFFNPEGEKTGAYGFGSSVKWIGWLVAIGVAIWSLSSWDDWSGYGGFGGWFVTNVWAVIILGVVIAVIFIVKGKNS